MLITYLATSQQLFYAVSNFKINIVARLNLVFMVTFNFTVTYGTAQFKLYTHIA